MSTNLHRVSVIIPTFNREKTLGRAIESVLAQTHVPLELIVVDGGSTDGTFSLLKNYQKDLKVIQRNLRGVSEARNIGISLAEGDWLAFLDSDDEWKPSKLEKQFAWLEKNPSYKIIQTQEDWIRNGRWANPKKKHAKIGGWIFKESLSLCLVSPSSVMIHRTLFERFGAFDEELLACEDYDLWLRISLEEPIGLLDESLIVKYGGHEDQLSRSIWGIDRFRIKSLENLLQKANLKEDQRLLVREKLKEKIEIVLKGAHKRDDRKDLIAFYEKKLKDLFP
ncbi:hypothetical protein AB834_05780 [PVC group bacterium (ex Bugula neritina AB1)]|nr:hypothetical protein AB834_05780 [PVC group bacterium (ex Bugula neritina AB1)]